MMQSQVLALAYGDPKAAERFNVRACLAKAVRQRASAEYVYTHLAEIGEFLPCDRVRGRGAVSER
jgi:hypothetical protein